VAPVHLLSASFQPEDVPIQNTIRLAPRDMRAWIRGETPIPGGDHRSYFDNISEEEWDERQKLWEKEKRLGIAGWPPTREKVVESLAQFHEEQEQTLDTGKRPGDEIPMSLSGEGRRQKGQLDASRRARKAAEAAREKK
jgi:hypothetical protein